MHRAAGTQGIHVEDPEAHAAPEAMHHHQGGTVPELGAHGHRPYLVLVWERHVTGQELVLETWGEGIQGRAMSLFSNSTIILLGLLLFSPVPPFPSPS